MRYTIPALLVFAALAAHPGCRREPPSEPPVPAADPAAAEAAALALARCEVAADRGCVATHLDLDAKAGILFGALFTEANDATRKAARTMLLDLFMAAGPSLRERHFGGGVGEWSVDSADGDRAVVIEAGETLRLEYRVRRTEAGWRVEDRVRLRGEHRADPKVLVDKFLRDFEKQHDRKATLADVNRDLPGFVGSHRARTLRIPKKGAKRAEGKR
ncbi:MAG: hypothetical protein ABIK09_02005 [Pseudomonadota bacterium]